MSDNSGPAYPQPAGPAGFRQKWSDGYGGLSKREYVATEALKGLLGNPKIIGQFEDFCDGDSRHIVCCIAIEHADALLEALGND